MLGDGRSHPDGEKQPSKLPGCPDDLMVARLHLVALYASATGWEREECTGIETQAQKREAMRRKERIGK
jgi:hypothetical protein